MAEQSKEPRNSISDLTRGEHAVLFGSAHLYQHGHEREAGVSQQASGTALRASFKDHLQGMCPSFHLHDEQQLWQEAAK